MPRKQPSAADIVFNAMRRGPACWNCSKPLKSALQGLSRRGQLCTKCKQKREICPGCGDTVRLGKLINAFCDVLHGPIYWCCGWDKFRTGQGYWAETGRYKRTWVGIHDGYAKDCRA